MRVAPTQAIVAQLGTSATAAIINAPNVYVGGSASGAGGSGVFTVASNVTLNTSGAVKIYDTGTTKIALSGGTITRLARYQRRARALRIHLRHAQFDGRPAPQSARADTGVGLDLSSGKKLVVSGVTTIAASASLTVSAGELQASSISNSGTFPRPAGRWA
jgi:hypothetical protein